MTRAFHNRTDRRIGIAAGLLSGVLAVLASQQLSRAGSISAAGLGDIAYRAAPFGSLSGEHQQVASGRQR